MMLKLEGRLAKLEATVRPTTGKHLAFLIEAPHDLPKADHIAFLRSRGHVVHDDDTIFVLNFACNQTDYDGTVRDLTPRLVTEEVRAAAPSAGAWPRMTKPFTFTLDSPGQPE